jgi:hypothetical protein
MRSKLLFGLLVLVNTALPFNTAVAQSEVDVSIVRPDWDYGKYQSFLIQPLKITNTLLVPPPWVEGKDGKPRPWNISKKNAAFLQDQYHGAMKKQLEELGGYTLVEEPASTVIAVEIEMISLTPYAQPKDKVITKGSGEMTFRAEVRDSMTREILVIYEGNTPVGKEYNENTQFTIDQNVNELFQEWGEFLRQGLNRGKAGQAGS